MSSFQDARWLRRLWSLAAPGDPDARYIANVQVINDRAYGSSRERAPHAQHSNTIAAPAAGTHNFVEIGGLDGLGPTVNLLHHGAFEAQMSGVLTGIISWFLGSAGALTTATRVATAPKFIDPDSDVTPTLFQGTILTANLPASRTNLPRANGIGQTAATPTFATSVTTVERLGALPFAASWDGPQNLFFFSETDGVFLLYKLAWQAMRS
jgi:hypothetical protein